jgi:hypothetical protein
VTVDLAAVDDWPGNAAVPDALVRHSGGVLEIGLPKMKAGVRTVAVPVSALSAAVHWLTTGLALGQIGGPPIG